VDDGLPSCSRGAHRSPCLLRHIRRTDETSTFCSIFLEIYKTVFQLLSEWEGQRRLELQMRKLLSRCAVLDQRRNHFQSTLEHFFHTFLQDICRWYLVDLISNRTMIAATESSSCYHTNISMGWDQEVIWLKCSEYRPVLETTGGDFHENLRRWIDTHLSVLPLWFLLDYSYWRPRLRCWQRCSSRRSSLLLREIQFVYDVALG